MGVLPLEDMLTGGHKKKKMLILTVNAEFQ